MLHALTVVLPMWRLSCGNGGIVVASVGVVAGYS